MPCYGFVENNDAVPDPNQATSGIERIFTKYSSNVVRATGGIVGRVRFDTVPSECDEAEAAIQRTKELMECLFLCSSPRRKGFTLLSVSSLLTNQLSLPESELACSGTKIGSMRRKSNTLKSSDEYRDV